MIDKITQFQTLPYQNTDSFNQRVRDFLLRNEALHHAMLSQFDTITHSAQTLQQCPELISIESNGEILAVAINNAGNRVFISMLTHLDAVDLLAQHLQKYGTLSMVNAPPNIAQHFAQVWTQLTGQVHKLEMTLCAYRLQQLHPFTWTKGQLRQATTADISLVNQWFVAFFEEALGSLAHYSQDWVNQQIHEGHVFLWEDGVPVSMGCKMGQAANGYRVSFIFTPPEYRQKGYGKTCTAAVTQRLLDDGQRYCFLYADKNNTVTKLMYEAIARSAAPEAIGYELMGETQNYLFTSSP
jgi:predicted GNAT family acetyltransferase